MEPRDPCATTIESAFALGSKEMIVVLPDSKTMHNGSMYSSSVTTGDFELFIAQDLVAYIDNHYRTIADRQARGLVGHSMGGYGAARIGMKHADVFGSLYIMSPCCLSPRPASMPNAETNGPDKLEEMAKTLHSPMDSASLPWGIRTQLASAAAWSPDPNRPRCTSISPHRTEWSSRMCLRSGPRMRRWRSSISMWTVSGCTVPFHST